MKQKIAENVEKRFLGSKNAHLSVVALKLREFFIFWHFKFNVWLKFLAKLNFALKRVIASGTDLFLAKLNFA